MIIAYALEMKEDRFIIVIAKEVVSDVICMYISNYKNIQVHVNR